MHKSGRRAFYAEEIYAKTLKQRCAQWFVGQHRGPCSRAEMSTNHRRPYM